MAADAPPPTAVQPPLAITTVGSVARALVGAGTLSELAEHALAAMCHALGLRVAALYLPEADNLPILRRFAASGVDVDSVGLLDELRFEQEAWRLASAGGRALVFHEPATWLVANPFDPPASAWLVLPLDAGGEVLGVVAAAQRDPFALDETSARPPAEASRQASCSKRSSSSRPTFSTRAPEAAKRRRTGTSSASGR